MHTNDNGSLTKFGMYQGGFVGKDTWNNAKYFTGGVRAFFNGKPSDPPLSGNIRPVRRPRRG